MQCEAISIHALLAESDGKRSSLKNILQHISIHALLAESDRRDGIRQLHGQRFLSTLSLRRATIRQFACVHLHKYFYPRSPCGERRYGVYRTYHAKNISIHALLAESDPQPGLHRAAYRHFYPRSPCGERRRNLLPISTACYFYPRSPCGERLNTTRVGVSGKLFLSTLSLRRAT